MPTLKERFYMIPGPDRKRTKPMEVMALGLSRSGTDSLRRALDMLGYENTYHAWVSIAQPPDWVVWSELAVRKFHSHNQADKAFTTADFDRVLGDSTALTDQPCVSFTRELILAYPDAKVILNQRKDMDAWHTSWLKAIQPWHDSWWRWSAAWFSCEQFWLYRGFDLTNMNQYRGDFRASGRYVHEEHLAMVRGLVPKGNLLEWSVEDGWGPLCEYLGKEVPDVPFPSGNAAEDMAERTGRTLYRLDNEAMRNMVLTGAAVVAAVGGLAWRFGAGNALSRLWT